MCWGEELGSMGRKVSRDFSRRYALATVLLLVTAAATAQVQWDFKDPAGKTFGWFSMHGLSSPKVVPGEGLKLVKTSNDPHLARRKIKLKAEELDRLIVTMTLKAAEDFAVKGEPRAQFFWDVENSGYSEKRSVQFPVKIDGDSHRYEVDLWSEMEWRGTITAVRIDPIDQDTTGTLEFTIASVQLRPLTEDEAAKIENPIVASDSTEGFHPDVVRLAFPTTYTVHLDTRLVTSGTGKQIDLKRDDMPTSATWGHGAHELVIEAGPPLNKNWKLLQKPE
jgi:hypothetical protein